jgi:Domain of unknown function (DUF4157)
MAIGMMSGGGRMASSGGAASALTGAQRSRGTPSPRQPALQRKCACGGGASALSGSCEDCASKKLGLQTLALGRPGDSYEREADHAAHQAMQGATGLAKGLSRVSPAHLAGAQATRQTESAPESVQRTLAEPGRGLEAAPRALMERRFGRSFADVRIHAGARAGESARDVGARAYTQGRDIAFAAGEYRPGTADGLSLLAHELAHVVQQSGDAGAPVQRDLAIEPKGVNKTERKLSEKDINDAIAFNKTRIKKKETLREIRDVIGIDRDPAVSDRDLALGVARWQASHGVAQDGQLGPVTVMLLVEELQAESTLVPGLGAEADTLKGQFAKGTFLDIDTSFCGCKPSLQDEIKSADGMIAHYTACGADPANKSGGDIEACVNKRAGGVTLLGSTSSTGAITMTSARKGPCAVLMSRIDVAHEQIHSVHTSELKQQHGAGTAAFTKAFNDPADWVADEINSRNTDKSLATWALSVLERICP